MNDGDALLRGILENPADDAPRLVYADWLEENGQDARAEFIRVQIELVKRGFTPRCPKCNSYGGPCNTCEALDVEDLRRREGELLKDPGVSWAWTLFQSLDWPLGNCQVTPVGTRSSMKERLISWEYHCGFLHTIRMSQENFLEHAGKLFSVAPIQKVELTDKKASGPWGNMPWLQSSHICDGKYWWYKNVHSMINLPGHHIPAALHPYLGGKKFPGVLRHSAFYQTAQDAADDLSRACVAYGRAQAGLPQLDSSMSMPDRVEQKALIP